VAITTTERQLKAAAQYLLATYTNTQKQDERKKRQKHDMNLNASTRIMQCNEIRADICAISKVNILPALVVRERIFGRQRRSPARSIEQFAQFGVQLLVRIVAHIGSDVCFESGFRETVVDLLYKIMRK